MPLPDGLETLHDEFENYWLVAYAQNWATLMKAAGCLRRGAFSQVLKLGDSDLAVSLARLVAAVNEAQGACWEDQQCQEGEPGLALKLNVPLNALVVCHLEGEAQKRRRASVCQVYASLHLDLVDGED